MDTRIVILVVSIDVSRHLPVVSGVVFLSYPPLDSGSAHANAGRGRGYYPNAADRLPTATDRPRSIGVTSAGCPFPRTK